MSISKVPITIGWFGIPGGREGGLTHLVNCLRIPVCGTRIHPKSEYQWCYPDWKGVVECERCKKIQLRLADEERNSKAEQIKPRRPNRLNKLRQLGAIHFGNELLSRIQNYLGNGGLFNPELMEHSKVRDLLMDCRTYIENVKHI